MASPADRRYTKTHEWVSLDGDVATIGITDFAQGELGDITYLELPEIGDAITHDQPFGIVESVKAANDVFSPSTAKSSSATKTRLQLRRRLTSRRTTGPGWCASGWPSRTRWAT